MSGQEPTFKGRALFKGRDTSWGVFYPTDYILAIFESFQSAQRAKETLLSAGYSDDEVDAVPSDYVISDIEKGIKNAALLNHVKQRISRAIGCEACYWEGDLKWAKEGAGFLAVYCPTEHEGERVLRLLSPLKPKVMRRYERLWIVEMI